ncbi:MAG TPA: MBL fold metallo-hydrolase [Candidatus Limnocylindrales bacterium]|jgi:L-ascorbate metabolism protein UlaG (beta-lactamase superfamily)|nr:MBL fold metallo-hydrolase [Candidatus Limnocylindrales bacterium]
MEPSPTARVTFLGHSTVLLELDGARLLTDPILGGRVGPLRRHGSAVPMELLEGIDAVLVSHLHWDHLHLPSIRLVPGDPLLVVPRGAGRALTRRGFHRVEELDPGGTVGLRSVTVSGTSARHAVYAPMAPRADSLGFLVRGERTVYFAGDTDLFDEMEQLTPAHETLDLALLPVWGWGPFLGRGHLDPLRAANALRLLRPRLAIPIHWGALYPVGIPWRRPHALRDAPHHFLRLAAGIAPEVEIRVLEPGESTNLDG